MTDEDAFLRAVIADPDDDAPRLIYADWLDEHGQGERAEFIRVQIALYELRKNQIAEGVPELRRREHRLLQRHEALWTQPLRPLAKQWKFYRGFVESIVCYADEFVSRGGDLLSLAPIRELCLANAHFCALQLSQCPYLRRPLWLSLDRTWLSDWDVAHLANSQYFGRLTCLSLSHNQITAAGAISLARSPYLGSLDDLYLKGNDIPRVARTELRRRFGSRVHF